LFFRIPLVDIALAFLVYSGVQVVVTPFLKWAVERSRKPSHDRQGIVVTISSWFSVTTLCFFFWFGKLGIFQSNVVHIGYLSTILAFTAVTAALVRHEKRDRRPSRS
jgi:dolichol kinase